MQGPAGCPVGARSVRIAPMTADARFLVATTHTRDAAYDVVLLAHVLAAVIGLGAVMVSGAYAWALLRSGSGSEAVRRYYRPGVNWAGRVLFLIPLLGLALMGMSHGDWSFSDGWVLGGLALWMGVAVVAEMALWPAERRLQGLVARGPGGAGGASGMLPGVASPSEPEPGPGLRSECLRVMGMAAALAVVLLVAAVMMVAKP